MVRFAYLDRENYAYVGDHPREWPPSFAWMVATIRANDGQRKIKKFSLFYRSPIKTIRNIVRVWWELFHKATMILSVDFVRDMRRSVAIKCLIITAMSYLDDTSALRLGKASYWGVMMFWDVRFWELLFFSVGASSLPQRQKKGHSLMDVSFPYLYAFSKGMSLSRV